MKYFHLNAFTAHVNVGIRPPGKKSEDRFPKQMEELLGAPQLTIQARSFDNGDDVSFQLNSFCDACLGECLTVEISVLRCGHSICKSCIWIEMISQCPKCSSLESASDESVLNQPNPIDQERLSPKITSEKYFYQHDVNETNPTPDPGNSFVLDLTGGNGGQDLPRHFLNASISTSEENGRSESTLLAPCICFLGGETIVRCQCEEESGEERLPLLSQVGLRSYFGDVSSDSQTSESAVNSHSLDSTSQEDELMTASSIRDYLNSDGNSHARWAVPLLLMLFGSGLSAAPLERFVEGFLIRNNNWNLVFLPFIAVGLPAFAVGVAGFLRFCALSFRDIGKEETNRVTLCSGVAVASILILQSRAYAYVAENHSGTVPTLLCAFYFFPFCVFGLLLWFHAMLHCSVIAARVVFNRRGERS